MYNSFIYLYIIIYQPDIVCIYYVSINKFFNVLYYLFEKIGNNNLYWGLWIFQKIDFTLKILSFGRFALKPSSNSIDYGHTNTLFSKLYIDYLSSYISTIFSNLGLVWICTNERKEEKKGVILCSLGPQANVRKNSVLDTHHNKDRLRAGASGQSLGSSPGKVPQTKPLQNLSMQPSCRFPLFYSHTHVNQNFSRYWSIS